MSSQLEIRICKESIIQEIERLYSPDKFDYFKSIALQLESDKDFSCFSISLDENEYTRFIKNIKRFQTPTTDYYQKTGGILKNLLHLSDARIWTRKETLEVHEALVESYDIQAENTFSPLLCQVEQGQVFLLMLKHNQEIS